MNALLRAAFTVAALAVLPCAHAESLRCNGASASEGDSKLSVLYKCGQPVITDTYCAPVYYGGTLNPVPAPFASLVVPCQPLTTVLSCSHVDF